MRDEAPEKPTGYTDRRAPQELTPEHVDILAAWITHAHEEIHRYLRQRQTILQIVVVTASAALAAIGQRDDLAQPILVLAPYVLSVAVINWLNCGAEVSISGAVVDECEEMIRAESGHYLLFQERVANGLRPNSLGGRIGDYTPMVFVVAAYVASAVVGFHWDWFGWTQWRWYAGLNVLVLALLFGLILLHSSQVDGMRGRTRAYIQAVRHWE